MANGLDYISGPSPINGVNITDQPLNIADYGFPPPQPAPGNDGAYVDPYGGYGSYEAQQTAIQQAALDAAQRDALNAQLGRLDPQQATGLSNISNSYNQSANRLDQQKGIAKRNYDVGVEDTTRGYQTTRNNIGTRVRNRQNALQRLLGIAGSGNSSAAEESAPYAALREGTVNLTGAQQSYATNRRNQDTNWQDTERNYTNSFEDLNQDKYSKEQGLKASIAQTRASILDKLASIGTNRDQYTGQINSLLDQITQLGNQYAAPVLRTGNVAYAAPSLQQYSLNARQPNVQLAPDQQSVASSIDPSLVPLLPRKDVDEFGNPIG